MPLQNRIDPLGRIVADPGRGALIGNRGILHDELRRIVRTHSSPAWITCVLSWRGRRRRVMTGRTWTELFFLDEATALAAGHRPCAYCRRSDYNAFVAAWSQGNPSLAPRTGRRAPVVDRALHTERRRADGRKRTFRASIADLPPGTMILDGPSPLLVVEEGLFVPWSFSGYGPPRPRPAAMVEVLTPRSTVAALGAGYVPALHPSSADRGDRP